MGIEKVIKPTSLAIVGPTDKQGSFGCYAAQNALKSSIVDRVYFVHPKRETLFGKRCYPSLADLPEVVDCVEICTPAPTVNGLLTQAGKLGIGGAVVFASGFAEAGNDHDKAMEKEMQEICQRYNIKLIGPNCVGVANNLDGVYLWGLNLPFEQRKMSKGAGVIAQSGSLIGGVCHKEHVDVVMAISTGNGNILPLEECMEYLVESPGITSVIVYMEGIKDGARFCSALEKAAKLCKPIILLKSGKSAQGAKSAASHTGNMAGDNVVFDAVFKKYGVISVDSVDEFVSMAQIVSILDGKYPKQEGAATISFSGGESTVMADLCERANIPLPDLSPETADIVKKFIPDFAAAKNPLDATTSMFTQEDNFLQVFTAVGQDLSMGSIILSMELTGEENARHRCSMAALKGYAADKTRNCSIFVHPFYENTRNPKWRAELAQAGIPVLGCGDSGLSVLRKLLNFAGYRPQEHDLTPAAHEIPKTGLTTALSEFDSKELVAKHGIKIPRQFVARDENAILKGLQQMKYPLALKIDSPDILHKTDAGGVVLNVSSEEQAVLAAKQILQNCRTYAPDAEINGVLVQEMAEKGVEVIIGIKNDAQLGPMLLVGMGGIFTEIFCDTALCPCPVSREEAREMLKSLKSYKLLTGYRGSKPCDISAVEDMLVQLSRFAAENRDTIAEMEMNPVFVNENGAIAVDALVIKYDK